jgi:signal transduction histidine kinase
MAHVLAGITLLALAGAGGLSTVMVVRPLLRRLERLCASAERVGEATGYQEGGDLERDEVGELSRILDGAHARILNESSRLKSREVILERHLADVSHDLRTPLTSTQMALEQVNVLVSDPEARELIRRALTDTVYTSELTENLRVARQLREGVDPASLERRTELTAIVEQVVHRFALLGKHRGVQVEAALPSAPLVTAGHPLWVEQAVTNLVHQAVTHGGEGGHVAVLLEEGDGELFRLTVLDDGPIAIENPATPDPKGIRSDRARPRDPPGSGLGLAVAAAVCRMHNWDLRLESKIPGGRCVTIEGKRVPPPPELERTAISGEESDPTLPSSWQSFESDEPADVVSAVDLPVRAHPGRARVVSRLWRRLTPRLLLAAGLAAALGVLSAGLVWTPFVASEILAGATRYARDLAADGFAVCLASPATWSQVRRVGRLDAYDAKTLRSANPSSPPVDRALASRLRRGEQAPARLFLTEAQWGGAVLTQLLPSGPCTLFQMSWHAAPGSSARGLGLLLAATVVSVAGTIAIATFVAVRPSVTRLVRLRRAAERLGQDEGYEPGTDAEADEIGRLSAIVDRAHARVQLEAQRLRARQRTLERHLGDIAHDLRTPLSSAQLALEQASRLLDGDLGALVRRALNDIVYTGELTENLRLATQFREGGSIDEQDPITDLAAVVERVVARFTLLGRNRGVRLEGSSPGRPILARAHPVWTEQAVANVVHNAVTHGPEGTRVAVLVELTQDDRFSITVLDDGPGVRRKDLGRLVERSFRSSRARRRNPGGSGHGLAITAEICRRNGWSLRLDAETPRGLRVTIVGPTTEASEAMAASDALASRAALDRLSGPSTAPAARS